MMVMLKLSAKYGFNHDVNLSQKEGKVTLMYEKIAACFYQLS